jgi:peroxiredoxin Q/BCP
VEGQVLRDRAAEYAAAGCVVLGASFDAPAETRAFATAQSFRFPLLSDPERRAGRAYQVTRQSDDQYAAFPLRISYLIGPDGVIRRSYAVADVAGHADEVLRDLARLRPAA